MTPPERAPGDTPDVEIPLAGGTVTPVARVGDTVRRATGPWTPTVHAVLRHLEEVGFDRCPRVLGFDERGREVLTWIEGAGATRPFPAALRSLRGVAALGRLVRLFHEAMEGFVAPADAVWQSGPPRPEVVDRGFVCHGDLGPWNTIWRDGEPVALIDFDAIQLGRPEEDLAYLAGHVVPLRGDLIAAEAGFGVTLDRAARLQGLQTAYGWDPAVDIRATVAEVLQLDRSRIIDLGGRGEAPWATFLALGQHDRASEDLAWIATHGDELSS